MFRDLTAVCLLGACVMFAGSARAELRVSGLRCESLVEPIGLGETEPRFTWVLASDRRGAVQTAYRVLVASSPELLEQGRGDLWDSGRVESSESAFVPYGGEPLGSRQRCYWSVRAWDGAGEAGPWSEPASFETGLLKPEDWSAAWIDASAEPAKVEIVSAEYRAVDGSVSVDVTDRVRQMLERGEPIVASNEGMGGDPKYGVRKVLELEYVWHGERERAEVGENGSAPIPGGRVPYLRRGFEVSKPVERARLYATALGVYVPHLNGERVGDHRMAPGWTDYRERVQVQTFDVTDQLSPGENTIGAVVGPGWFAGRAGLFGARAFYGEHPALRAQLEITYTDGSTETIATDERWTRKAGPILMADIMDGEVYDARLATPGWCAAGVKNGDTWEPVTVREEDRNLVAQTDHPVRVLGELPALSVNEPEPGRWVFDLGQNMVGVVRLRVDEPEGTRVTLRHAEMLNGDGTLYTENLRAAAATDTYVCRGGGIETWAPEFTFHGFRYVEVTGLTGEPDPGTVTGLVVGTDLPPAGTFACSDDRLNQLFSNIVWGLRGNALSIPTDCPQRDERMGWTADMQVFTPTAFYLTEFGPFMEKWMRDVRDAQRTDGAHSDVAPVMEGLNYGTPVWGDAGTIVPWVVYRATGDTRILEENIDSMRRWVDWCVEHSTGLIRDRDRGNDYGDWLSIDADTPKDVIGTAYFARSAWIVSQAFEVLGNDTLAAWYAGLFGEIRDAFISRYVSDDGTVEGDTQTCYLISLRFDLLPERLRKAAFGHLVDDLRSRGWRLTTGFVGVSHMLPVLDEMGRPDLAYRLLTQDAFPSWLFSVRHGATTIWERWNGWTPGGGMNDPGMNSFNHFALGSCGEWLFAGVAGIRPFPDDAGYGRFVIEPEIAGPLTWAQATYRSVRGEIESGWSLNGDELTLKVEVPANTVAAVVIPAREGGPVLESGEPIDGAEGVTVIGRRGDALITRVGSGSYTFVSTAPGFRPGNPVFGGWYADPEVALFDDRVWIFPTYSAPYDEQLHFDAFSSSDLVRWTKHERVLDSDAIAWARRAMWAPSVVEKGGKYYFFFGANDIQNDDEHGGIGVAVADSPEGPYEDLLGEPLIDAFHHGAQPIDQFVFRDADGTDYLIYGGWRHCNIARLNEDYTGFVPFDDGETFREITPDGYVEGPFMFIRDGRYYFMWSEGGWTGPDYSVAYAVADSPLGPFERVGKILKQDPAIATGAGHHSVLRLPGGEGAADDRFYIVYHRRPLGETDRNHRVVCIDEMRFDEDGRIEPVEITFEGVEAVEVGAP